MIVFMHDSDEYVR